MYLLSLSLSLSTVRARSPTAPSLLYLRLSGGPLAEGLEIQKSPTQRERGGEISSRLASRIESVDDDARLRAEVAHETARGKNECEWWGRQSASEEVAADEAHKYVRDSAGARSVVQRSGAAVAKVHGVHIRTALHRFLRTRKVAVLCRAPQRELRLRGRDRGCAPLLLLRHSTIQPHRTKACGDARNAA